MKKQQRSAEEVGKLLQTSICPTHLSVRPPSSASSCQHHCFPQQSPLTIHISVTLSLMGSLSLAVEDSEEGCEVNGRLYRDGEVFQPSCKLQCRCLDGGFTCVPLCQEDVRLPTLDCPFPRRVEIPGKCCPEWICEVRDQHLLRDAGTGKMQEVSVRGCPHRSLGMVPSPPTINITRRHLISPPHRAMPAAPAAQCLAPNTPFPSSLSIQPLGQCPRCCRTPARSGAQSGAPAQSPVAWASRPASPTRTATAGWRLSGGSAWPDPAQLCRQHPQW